jgi:hypothetical protein
MALWGREFSFRRQHLGARIVPDTGSSAHPRQPKTGLGVGSSQAAMVHLPEWIHVTGEEALEPPSS